MNKAQDNEETSFIEKASYGVLGFGRSLPGLMVSLFILVFYTDVFGIPVQYTTAMLLIFSIWEGFSKQIAGFFMGWTKSRYGKYKPFILWTIVPYALFSTLMFLAPGLSVSNKIIYAYITYFTWAIINNTLSIAHNSILPMMSKNLPERTRINSFKIICCVFASVVVSSFALKFVDFIGAGNQQAGFFITMLGISLIGMPIQYFSFKNIKERYAPVNQHRISFKTAFNCILKDNRLILLFLVYCTFWIACTFKNQSTVYYIKYVLERPEFTGTFFMIGTTSSFTMHFFISRIVSYIKVEAAMIIGMFGSIVGVIIMYAAKDNLLLLSLGNVVFGLMSAFPANLIYVALAGYVDEKNNQYKTNLGSWLYSSMDNLAKIGIGIGGAGFSYLLYAFGYEPNVQQTALALFGIKLGFSGGAGVAALACLIVVAFYMNAVKKQALNMTV